MKDAFHRFANAVSQHVGSPTAFVAALALIVGWAVSGPFFGFSDTWQLAINTTTTIVTFLMVFVIQHTQNRDALALHLKLDELIRAVKAARNDLIDLEDASDDEIDERKAEFQRLKGLRVTRLPADGLAGPPVPAAEQGHEARHE